MVKLTAPLEHPVHQGRPLKNASQQAAYELYGLTDEGIAVVEGRDEH